MGASDVIKINLHDKEKDPGLWAVAEQFQGEPGRADVFGHGEPKTIYDDRNGKHEELDALKVAKLLEEKGATSDTHVFLHSCNTGKGQHSMARELSQYYVHVEAATDVFSTPVNVPAKNLADLREHRKIDNNGRFKEFHAADYGYSKEHPEIIDSPQSQLAGPKDLLVKENGITVYRNTQDMGDEKPFIESLPTPFQASKPISISEGIANAEQHKKHIAEISAVYENAVDTNKTAEEQKSAIDAATGEFGELKTAFALRDKMLENLTNKSPEAIKGIDGYIVNTIKSDKIEALDNDLNRNIGANQQSKADVTLTPQETLKDAVDMINKAQLPPDAKTGMLALLAGALSQTGATVKEEVYTAEQASQRGLG